MAWLATALSGQFRPADGNVTRCIDRQFNAAAADFRDFDDHVFADTNRLTVFSRQYQHALNSLRILIDRLGGRHSATVPQDDGTVKLAPFVITGPNYAIVMPDRGPKRDIAGFFRRLGGTRVWRTHASAAAAGSSPR